jgi:50S ribosomal protein L16 3-hydroxylase
MRFPDAMSPGKFLSGFWQKRPLFMPGALDGIHPTLDADELAWLATQPDVESRLVFTHVDGQVTRYEARDGPFAEDELASLPRQNWTLLVQDVEKHLPDFRAFLAAVDFIPDWRVDDLMVSYAAPGGGVGPHLDNYDVFLCQGEGQREWRLGDASACQPDPSSGDLSLLRPFIDEAPHIASDGDVLYLPPGVPHWGIATDFCMTWSIGMRAPNLAELKAGAARVLDMQHQQALDTSAADTEVFYEDPDLSVDEAGPGFISDAAIRRARILLQDVVSLDDRAIATVLGCVVTDPKAWLEPERMSDDRAKEFIDSVAANRKLDVHGMARIAFCVIGGSVWFFVNGNSREFSPACVEATRRICRDRRALPADLCAKDGPGLLHWLLTHGGIDLTELGR